MDKKEQFFATVKDEPCLILATAQGDSVTMRTVSPVYYAGCVLIFTDTASTKYRQLQANPHCCLAIGPFFAEATAEFLGATMLETNTEARRVYAEKFPGAFSRGCPLAVGRRNSSCCGPST